MGSMMGGGMMPPGGIAPRAGAIKVIALRHATAPELSTVLSRVFPTAEVTPESRSNQVIIRADDKTLTELEALIRQLDVDVQRK
jgi:type II secretory pathway component GspD/PulD (secretin)